MISGEQWRCAAMEETGAVREMLHPVDRYGCNGRDVSRGVLAIDRFGLLCLKGWF